MGFLIGLIAAFAIGFVVAAALSAVAIRASYPRLGIESAKEYASLLVHEILPERRSRFDKLEPRIARRLATERVALSSGSTLAMGHFSLTFAPADLAELQAVPERVLAANFEAVYLEHARQQGWELPQNGRVSFTFRQDVGFRPGAFSVVGSPTGHELLDGAESPSSGTGSPTAPAPTKLLSDAEATVPVDECHIVLRSADGAQSFASTAGSLRIGRSSANEFQLLSPGVSRVHAVIAHSGVGWSITPDPDATNGVYKGSTRVSGPWVIAERGVYSFGRKASIELLPECSHVRNGAA